MWEKAPTYTRAPPGPGRESREGCRAEVFFVKLLIKNVEICKFAIHGLVYAHSVVESVSDDSVFFSQFEVP